MMNKDGFESSADCEIHYMDVFGNIHALNFSQYPSGEPLVKFESDGDFDLLSIRRVLLRPKSMDGLLAGLFWLDAFNDRTGDMPQLILPCLPGARQDRLNDQGDFLFTAKSIANMINDRGFPSVTCVDPHSEVMPALIDRCRTIHITDFWDFSLGDYDLIISPDAGAEKRAGRVAKQCALPLVHAWKSRNVATGAISGFGIDTNSLDEILIDNLIIDERGEILDRPKLKALVVDDICDGGGTFIGLADAIQEKYDCFDLDLFVTHGFFSKGLFDLKKRYRKVITTDTVPNCDLQESKYQPQVIKICENMLKLGRASR